MRIAFFLPDLECGGAQRVMLTIARELSAHGKRVEIIAALGGGDLADNVPGEARLIEFSRSKKNNLVFTFFSIFNLVDYINHNRPDVIISSVTGANIVAIIAAKVLSKIPVKLVIREAVSIKGVSRVRRLLMKILYPMSDLIVVMTKSMAIGLSRLLGEKSPHIEIIENPVDLSYIEHKSCESVSHPWFLEDDLKFVLAVGRLVEQKDHITLVKAFSEISGNEKIRLIIIGDGPEKENLKQMVESLGIKNKVHLAGFDANPWKWMIKSDVFVLPSLWEGHPNALLEAIALGLPAVVTEYDESVKEMAVKHGILVVPTGDYKKIAQAVEKILREPYFVRKTGRITCMDSVIKKYKKVLLSV